MSEDFILEVKFTLKICFYPLNLKICVYLNSCLNLSFKHYHILPNPIASTSIGKEPRRLVSKTSESERRESVQSFLNLYHAEVLLPLLLDVVSTDSLRISIAPLDERLRSIFLLLLFLRFPFKLPRIAPNDGSHGIDPRRCCCVGI